MRESMQGEKSKQVVLEFLRLLAAGEHEDAARMFAEDGTFWVPGTLPLSGTLTGPEEILEKNFRAGRKLTVPGTRQFVVGTVLAEGAHVAAEWIVRRKVVNGEDYENFFFGLFRVEGDKIASLREYLDTLYAKEKLWPDVERRTT
jgi:ketosteroid isomerase-like protein